MVGGNATLGTVINVFYHAVNNSFDGIKYNGGKLNFKKVIEQKNKLVKKFRKEKYYNCHRNFLLVRRL
mgnify:CR=1 FL=1